MQKITIFIACMLLVSTFFVVTPDTVSADQDGDYFYTVSGGKATITGYNGSGGAISIPSTLGVYPTVAINDTAFYSTKGHLITSVIIPNSVTTIGTEAFKWCTQLTSATIGSGVTHGGYRIFLHCTSLISITLLEHDPPLDWCTCWIEETNPQITGHAYASSSFPGPGSVWENLLMGDYIPENDNPVFGTPSPTNGSTGNPLSLSWSIPITDEQNFDWTIKCSNGQTSGLTGASNGIKSLALSGLASSTTYTVWVNATDPTGSELYTRRWYRFTTQIAVVNTPPVFGVPSPANGSTGNPLSLSWSIPINDPNGNKFSWTIQCSNGQVDSGNGASNGTKSLALSGLAYSTAYTVWVNATDPTGSNLWTRRWYTFTTQGSGNNPPVFGTPSPADGSTGNQLSLSWSIPINDPEGNTFSWTIQCSNGQTMSINGASNGSKSLSLSGLAYLTTYKVWVNATDPTGSNQWTRRWFTFTTKASGGGGTLPPENQKPVADLSAGEPYQGFVNTEITFDGSKSSDSDGTIKLWSWNFGDGTNGSGKIITHVYTTAGTYQVTLTVTDNDAAISTDTSAVILKVNNPPTQPTIIGPVFGHKNVLYNFTVTSSDVDNDTIRYSIIWGDVTLYVNTSAFLPSNAQFTCGHLWKTPGVYNISVQAFDNRTDSPFAYHVILIDVEYVEDLGYLINLTGNSDYEMFYSNVTRNETSVQKQANGSYLIDSDGNGAWDYTFDPIIKELTSYQEPPKTPGFELVFVLCAIAIALFLWRKKRNQ